jgi:bifunctional DNA-binding transcriptional regulator/antitoxin component of YhaV-PrlF toxin-antitoxin module
VGQFLAVVKVDEKGRVLLSKELRHESGVQKNDHLIAKPLSKGKILLEKPARQPKRNEEDPLNWLLNHSGKIKSAEVKKEVNKSRSTRELIEKWKEQLWMGE